MNHRKENTGVKVSISDEDSDLLAPQTQVEANI